MQWSLPFFKILIIQHWVGLGFDLEISFYNRVPGGGVAFQLEELVLGFDNITNARYSFDFNLL